MCVPLITNADDFGASHAINAAVLRAYREGVLMSASLMVTGDAAREAVEIARDEPGLAVGLHLALSDARPSLSGGAVSDLVGRDGRFVADPVRAALKYHFSSGARAQVKNEIGAQFEAFARTGLSLSHVDGHQHLHAHPMVLPTVVEIAIRHGAHGIRVPRDPIWPNLRANRSRPGYKLAVALGHAYLALGCRRLLAETGLAYCGTVIGSLMSGQMSDAYAMRMLDDVNGSVEVFFHPSEEAGGAPFGPNRGDLEALLSHELKRFIVEREFELTTYVGLRGAREAARERS